MNSYNLGFIAIARSLAGLRKSPGQRFGDFIYTELGHYFEFSSRSYFMFPTVVQAFWYFDQHNKLREIRVRRFVRWW
jgi:hypothetical protein